MRGVFVEKTLEKNENKSMEECRMKWKNHGREKKELECFGI